MCYYIYRTISMKRYVILFTKQVSFLLVFWLVFVLYSSGYAVDYQCGYEPQGCDQNPDCSAVVERCNGPYNGQYLCPINQTACNLSYACPSGGSYNASVGKCQVDPAVSCSSGLGGCKIRSSRVNIYSYWRGRRSDVVWSDGGSWRRGYFDLSCNTDGTFCSRSNNMWYGWDRSYVSVGVSGMNLRLYFWYDWKNYWGHHVVNASKNITLSQCGDISDTVCVYEDHDGVTLCAHFYVSTMCSCPSGYTYNSSTGKCEMPAQAVYVCPLGNYPCINTGSGYYCSPYQCVDTVNQSNVENTDTNEGVNDKKDDGKRDVNGDCRGVIRIFNGKDLRCRSPGIETGFSDCCKKTKTWFGLGRCGSGERMLAKLRTTVQYRGQERDYTAADANCHYVGSYCAKKIKFIGCVQKKKTFCCFSSPLARIVQEQGRPQIGKGWGDPKNPDCSGFTVEEFQKLDFSKIDFSEWINMVVSDTATSLRNDLPNRTQNIRENIQNMYR